MASKINKYGENDLHRNEEWGISGWTFLGKFLGKKELRQRNPLSTCLFNILLESGIGRGKFSGNFIGGKNRKTNYLNKQIGNWRSSMNGWQKRAL